MSPTFSPAVLFKPQGVGPDRDVVVGDGANGARKLAGRRAPAMRISVRRSVPVATSIVPSVARALAAQDDAAGGDPQVPGDLVPAGEEQHRAADALRVRLGRRET